MNLFGKYQRKYRADSNCRFFLLCRRIMEENYHNLITFKIHEKYIKNGCIKLVFQRLLWIPERSFMVYNFSQNCTQQRSKRLELVITSIKESERFATKRLINYSANYPVTIVPNTTRNN